MTVNSIALLAQQSQAAYVDLTANLSGIPLATALAGQPDAAFTVTQSETFAATQTVLLQYNDDAAVAGATGSSLSLTVFQGNDGKLTLAIRGTLESGDFAPTGH